MKIKKTAIRLNNQQIESLSNQPESGMGYQICKVKTKSGMAYDDVTVLNSSEIRDSNGVPFTADDIESIVVTDKK